MFRVWCSWPSSATLRRSLGNDLTGVARGVLGDREFGLISELVYEHCGINLRDGKKELVRARLAKRLRAGRYPTFGDYV